MTTPEPSPLPRFGIRHLLGLTAALAVAFTLAMKQNSQSRREFGNETEINAELSRLVLVDSLLTWTPVGISLFVCGCLAIWKFKRIEFTWHAGQLLALSEFVEGAFRAILIFWLPDTVSNYVWFGPPIVWVATIAVLARRFETISWLAFFVLRIIPVVSIAVIALPASFGYGLVAASTDVSQFAVLWLLPAAALVAIGFDVAQRRSRHWSHWWPIGTYLASCLFQIPFEYGWFGL
jgi:hypothetical protein